MINLTRKFTDIDIQEISMKQQSTQIEKCVCYRITILGTTGVWIYRMTTNVGLSNEERECLNWRFRNKENGVADRLNNMAQIIECPCDGGLLRFDPRFMFSRIDNRKNIMCYATMTLGRNAVRSYSLRRVILHFVTLKASCSKGGICCFEHKEQ